MSNKKTNGLGGANLCRFPIAFAFGGSLGKTHFEASWKAKFDEMGVRACASFGFRCREHFSFPRFSLYNLMLG